MTRFINNGDNTVTDTKTGLIWSNTLAKNVNHATALEKIAALGEGWRVPTCHELFTLVDHSKKIPAIDTEFFPDTESDCYWTDTQSQWNESAVWVVCFDDGCVDVYDLRRGNNACVRAVRSSQ